MAEIRAVYFIDGVKVRDAKTDLPTWAAPYVVEFAQAQINKPDMDRARVLATADEQETIKRRTR